MDLEVTTDSFSPGPPHENGTTSMGVRTNAQVLSPEGEARRWRQLVRWR